MYRVTGVLGSHEMVGHSLCQTKTQSNDMYIMKLFELYTYHKNNYYS